VGQTKTIGSRLPQKDYNLPSRAEFARSNVSTHHSGGFSAAAGWVPPYSTLAAGGRAELLPHSHMAAIRAELRSSAATRACKRQYQQQTSPILFSRIRNCDQRGGDTWGDTWQVSPQVARRSGSPQRILGSPRDVFQKARTSLQTTSMHVCMPVCDLSM